MPILSKFGIRSLLILANYSNPYYLLPQPGPWRVCNMVQNSARWIRVSGDGEGRGEVGRRREALKTPPHVIIFRWFLGSYRGGRGELHREGGEQCGWEGLHARPQLWGRGRLRGERPGQVVPNQTLSEEPNQTATLFQKKLWQSKCMKDYRISQDIHKEKMLFWTVIAFSGHIMKIPFF
jgi:hypothetical protein